MMLRSAHGHALLLALGGASVSISGVDAADARSNLYSRLHDKYEFPADPTGVDGSLSGYFPKTGGRKWAAIDNTGRHVMDFTGFDQHL